MLTYHEYEKAVYDWLMEKHNSDKSFTFSVRKNANKAAQYDYFIGTEKSMYFGATFWYIPVGFPGSSGDLIDLFFILENNSYKYHFEFSQTRSPDNEQNKIALELIQNLKEPLKEIFGLKSESGDDSRMETYKSQPTQENYENLETLFKDVNKDLVKLLPIVDNAIRKIKKLKPKFTAHRFTNEEFDDMQEKLKRRLDKIPDTDGNKDGGNGGGNTDTRGTDNGKNDGEQKELNFPLNQILYGPPGTGKTYNTINKALEIVGVNIGGKSRDEIKDVFDKLLIKDFNNDDGQIAFITFHQSMSYEEFIEGIKPQEPEKEGDQVSYKIKDGIFKKLCIKASFDIALKNESVETGKLLDFSLTYDNFVQQLEEKLTSEKTIELSTKNRGKVIIDSISQQGNIIIQHIGGTRTYTVSKSRLSKLQKSIENLNDITNINDSFRTIIGGSNSSVYWAVLNAIRTKSETKSISVQKRNYTWDEKTEVVQELKRDDYQGNTGKPFILIIDEINRGNISQIFGELITLIEEDKRLGKKEELETILPYSKEKFGVPPNLYLLGTMNTADRSVEALDSALRRRFSFVEIPPDYDVIRKEGSLEKGNLLIGTKDIDLAELLELINNRIEKLLDKDHLIGHSYFLSVDSILSLKTAFQDQIIPLLQEYFYGDFGKIGLVLGKDFFVDQGKQNNENIFAGFDESYETEGLQERPVYKLKSPQEMKEGEFEQAILNLIKTNNA